MNIARLTMILSVGAGLIPAAAHADPETSRSGWELPAITKTAANPFDVRPRWTHPAADRATPMVDMLFDNDDTRSRVRHRRQSLSAGDMRFSLESVRRRSDAADPYIRAPARYKSYSFALGTSWTSGDNQFLVGIGKTRLLQSQIALLAARHAVSSSTTSLGASWIRDDRIQLHAGWRHDGAARAANGPERLVNIAAGTPVGESGPEVTLELLPRTAHGISMGIEGRDATIASKDLTLMGRAASHDARLALFMRRHF